MRRQMLMVSNKGKQQNQDKNSAIQQLQENQVNQTQNDSLLQDGIRYDYNDSSDFYNDKQR